eukprot:7870771-Pyramimonas_sp.AAC.1
MNTVMPTLLSAKMTPEDKKWTPPVEVDRRMYPGQYGIMKPSVPSTARPPQTANTSPADPSVECDKTNGTHT